MRSTRARTVRADSPHQPVGRRPSAAPAGARPHEAETTAAARSLVNRLLVDSVLTGTTAAHALERFRRDARASHAAFWMLSDTHAECGVRADESAHVQAPATVNLTSQSAIIERLRRRGAVRARANDVSGLEELIPASVQSSVVIAGPCIRSAARFGVLVIGWTVAEPPCNDSGEMLLGVAASLLRRTLMQRVNDTAAVTDAILESVAHPIAVIDRNGTILAINPAWVAYVRNATTAFRDSAATGVNYFDICRRVAADGQADPGMLDGITRVAQGDSNYFQCIFAGDAATDVGLCTVTATPLHVPSGGAVIAYTVGTPEALTNLAERKGRRLFHRLTDAIPLPIWMLTPDGQLAYGNAQWMDAMGHVSAHETAAASWSDAFHPADRKRVVDAFRSAAASRTPFDLEVRLKAADRTYHWVACIGAPYTASDGRLDGYVGFCCDISARRHAEWALSELASKLVAAQESERSRIGRELHDDLGQQAALLASKFETLMRNVSLSRTRLREEIAEASDTVQQIAVAIHSLSHQLHPAKLELLGLVNTLDALCREISRDGGVSVRFETHDIPSTVPPRVALCLFRVAQEALQNAVKHSGAHDIDVKLVATASQLTLRVSDHGGGFDPLHSDASGIGLLTMRERVELSGGQLRIEAAPMAGTSIEATLPLARRPSEFGAP